MLITNKSIEIFEKGKNWEGDYEETSLGLFDVYLEEHSTIRKFTPGGGSSGQDTMSVAPVSVGFFILFDDINLNNKMIKYNEKSYSIENWDRYWEPDGEFHHIEADFK